MTDQQIPLKDITSESSSSLSEPQTFDPSNTTNMTRRKFVKNTSGLSAVSLMGTAALMTNSDDASANVEWAEWFQGNYQQYAEDYKKRKGVEADRPHRIKYRKLTR